MLVIGALAVAIGLALGLRFNVITLLLLTFAIVLLFAIGVLAGSSPLVFAVKMLATLASIQISYLFGCLLAAHFPPQTNRLDRTQARYLGGSSRTLAH
jgi:hypothetical protein